MKIEVRISPPESAPRDFFCEGPIDLKAAVMLVYNARKRTEHVLGGI